jgi:hypothetical protein
MIGMRRCLCMFRARALRRAGWTLGRRRRRTSIVGYSLRSIAIVARIVGRFQTGCAGNVSMDMCNHERVWLERERVGMNTSETLWWVQWWVFVLLGEAGRNLGAGLQ